MANTANLKDEVRDRAQDAKNMAEDVMEKGKQGAQQAMEKGKDIAHMAADKAKELGTAARDRADSGAASVGGGIRNAAEAIRERAPQSGMLGSAASQVTDTLENAGRYLEEKGVSGAADDLTVLIRKHPVPSVLIGIGLGILLGQFMTSSRR
jgi:ElaB/YqjD/DUF883 family membrane-anchored ribosome-binding protein